MASTTAPKTTKATKTALPPAPKVALTEARIRAFKPEGTNRIYWDAGEGAVKGFGVVVTMAGAKAYVLRYRVGGRQRQATLAQYAAISLKQARVEAGTQLLAIRSEGDDPLQRRQDAAAAPTVAFGLDKFFAEFGPARVADGLMVENTLAQYKTQARRYLYPELGNMKIEAVERADVRKMLSKVKGQVQRNRVHALTSRIFTYFDQEEEWRTSGNPASRIARAREHPRLRVLSADELAAMSVFIDDLPKVHAVLLRFLILTGWRCGEALGLQWDQLDFAAGTATLPRTKTGPAVKTIPTLALELLTSLPETNARVFTPASYITLRRRLLDVCGKAGIKDVRLHDLRRTLATQLGAAGESAFVVRDVLGHKTLTMAARYVQASDVGVAQGKAATRLVAMLEGKTADVADLAKEREKARAG